MIQDHIKFPTVPVIFIIFLFLIFGGWGTFYNIIYKLPDIVFFPYLFLEGDLPKMKIVMSETDFYQINFDSANPARADFSFNGSKKEVLLEYGSEISSFSKKSYKVTAVRDDLFNGVKSIELIPANQSAFMDLLKIHRAKKMGVLSPHFNLVGLNINERNEGVYFAFEGWTKELLEVERLPDTSIIFTAPEISSSDYQGLKNLLSVLSADDKTFEQRIGMIFDLEKFYSWNIAQALVVEENRQKSGLSVIVFNTATGKFEPTVRVNFENYDSDQGGVFYTLSKRILSVENFKDELNRRLERYISDGDSLKDDIEFYDNVYRASRTDFFKDFSKPESNFSFIMKHRGERKNLISSISLVFETPTYYMAEPNGTDKKITPQGYFGSFDEIFLSRAEFLVRNPRFVAGFRNSIVLPAGQHVFFKSVIIPEKYKLIIEPGASLYLDKGVSIISYSPAIIGGSGKEQVIFRPLNEHYSWGSFAVIGAKEEKSFLNNVNFKGGSGFAINGVIITGMAVFHESDVEINNSSFSESADDDALNVKYATLNIKNSSFNRTSADAIDLDYGRDDSVIENNKFYDIGYKIGGDGIDISQSVVFIKDNLVSGCSDKGISVGENSHPKILGNLIERCDMGIAVKDLSEAKISDAVFKDNRVGLTLYQKKAIFGGGYAELSGVEFINNRQETEIDKVSRLQYK